MKVLITGADGFLGKECVKQFQEKNYDVISTDRKGSVDYLGDLSDAVFCKSLPEVEVVIHSAAVQYVSKDLPLFYREKYFYLNNVVATRNLCDRYSGTNTHFVNIGTSMMYAQTGQDLYTIKSAMTGEGVYSRSKLKAQSCVNNIPNKTATILPCIIGGEGREGLFIGFVNLMKKYGIVIFPGKGEHKIHMVHVTDVASLIMLIVEKNASGYFNAAGPEPLSILGWVNEISAELNFKNIRKIRLPLAPIKLISYLTGYRILAREQLLMLEKTHVLSIEESINLGWKPKFCNAKIARSIASYIVNQ